MQNILYDVVAKAMRLPYHGNNAYARTYDVSHFLASTQN